MQMERMNDRVQAALSRALRDISRDFRFTWGETALCGNDQVAISNDAVRPEEGEIEHLVTVMAGVSPAESMAGLPWLVRDADTGEIRRVGQTDARGQFWLRDLDPADYRLQFEALVHGISAPVAPEFAAALLAEETPRQEFSSAGISGLLRVTAAGQWVLEITLDAKDWDPATKSLARFRILDLDNHLLLAGFLGLYDGGGYGCGQINIDLLDPTIRERIAGCMIQVAVVSQVDLVADDRASLRACEAITEHDAARAVLTRAITHLKKPDHGNQ